MANGCKIRTRPYWHKLQTAIISLLLPASFFISPAFTAAAHANGVEAPLLDTNSDYSEYWEQQFLFENGTLASSQFLIANFPFSRHHGLMVSTLKPADGPAIVIKNGRKRDGWNFDAAVPRLTIFQHQLEGSHPAYMMRLHNTAAELDIQINAEQDEISLIAPDNKDGLPEVSLYVPAAKGVGRWRPGPEIGGPGPEGAWRTLGEGRGYAIHVKQRSKLNDSVRRWLRLTAITDSPDYQPIIHQFESPEGDLHTVAVLIAPGKAPIRLENLRLVDTDDDNTWSVQASAGDLQLSGTITLNTKLEDFIISEQLTGIEKLVAGSLARIKRYRYAASYDLTLVENETVTRFSDRAIAENIEIGATKKKKRRIRR